MSSASDWISLAVTGPSVLSLHSLLCSRGIFGWRLKSPVSSWVVIVPVCTADVEVVSLVE